MSLVPRALPGLSDPRVAQVLQPRWDRARPRLRTAAVWLPVVQCGLVLAMLVTAALGRAGGSAWWVLPVAGGLAPAVLSWALAGRSGLFDPSSWARTAFLVGGCQLLLGGVPGFAIAANASDSALRVVVIALFALMWVSTVVGCVLASQAHGTLVRPLVPELGSTWFRLSLGARFTVARADLVLASVGVEGDRIVWNAHKHRARSSGPQLSGAVGFDQLSAMWTVELPEHAPPRPWALLSDGTELLTTPGPAVVLRTPRGDQLLPVHDAATFVELVNRRIALWRADSGHRPVA
ncbi:hypothetical protein [Streptoalloteichus hindustanus]|uniref:Uncharacterized protein n=1 Tax=Streptoalloteichus hindustanus TaxID=2017 RepID=A0A1M5ESW8_STRHI|nr:hypothetical protein [Streptoalloteichus hindustanus]SHF82201.1 hypothetical protein SAMN05444320_105116 [Streptoalloteichus hindustanus]